MQCRRLTPLRFSLLAPALGAIIALVAFAQLNAVSAQAAQTDGAFQVMLSGTQSLSQSVSVAGGNTARRVNYSLRTGGYPRLAITASQGRETLYPAGQPKTVTGPNGAKLQVTGVIQADGSAIDPVGGSKLFDLTVRGAILSDNSELLRFTSPASDPSSTLDFSVTFPSSEATTVSGSAQGTLTLAPSTDPAVVSHVWGTSAPSAASQPSTDDPTLWYLTRGAANTAYVLLAAVVALGIALGFQGFSGLVRAWRIHDLHQVLTLLMLAFVALHLATLFLDPAKPFSLLQLAWPLGETYRAVWTAFGVVSLYLLLVVTVSSYLRRALGNRAWFALHLLSYVAFVVVTLHGIFDGTDTTTPWMLGIYTAASALVVMLTLARLYVALATARRPRRDPAATRPVDPAALRR